MYWEAKKLQLIEKIIKIEDETVLAAVESAINKTDLKIPERKSFKDIEVFMSESEVDHLEKTIEEGCETIDLNEWK